MNIGCELNGRKEFRKTILGFFSDKKLHRYSELLINFALLYFLFSIFFSFKFSFK